MKCKLCENKVIKLKNSHIISKFIMNKINNHLKSTDRFLRSDSVKREQDSYKKELLCGSCEQLFQKYGESQFAETIFNPYLNKYQRAFKYDSWLNFFSASLTWRILDIYEEELLNANASLVGNSNKLDEVQNIQKVLKSYLLSKGEKMFPFYIENHLFNLDMSIYHDISDYYPVSFIKGSSITRVIHNEECFYVFNSFAGLALLTIIRKSKEDKFKGSIISHKKGVINLLKGQCIKSDILYLELKKIIKEAQLRTDYDAYKKAEKIAQELFEKNSEKRWATFHYLEIDNINRLYNNKKL